MLAWHVSLHHREPPWPRRPTAPPHDSGARAEKNQPLVDDIRLLGRILGDVIREQEGKEAFELVERVRQLSVAYRLKRDASAGRALDRLLKSLSGDQTVSVIRAFSYFSHLANIAEDRHHLRRRAVHERQGHLQEGSLAMALRAPGAARHRAPTIVARRSTTPTSRRCSPRTRPRCSARASSTPSARSPSCSARATPAPASASCADNEALIRARVTQLWQTRMLRTAKLTVADEIENALSYYRATFLRADPARSIARSRRRCPGHAIAPLLPHGQLDRRRPRRQPLSSAPTRCASRCARQSETALRHYLTEVHELGAELSMLGDAGAGDAASCSALADALARRTARTARTSPTGAR